jgi:hypothetical protein
VSSADAAALIESFGLSFDPHHFVTTFWIRVRSGATPSGYLPPLDEVVEELTHSELVREARVESPGTTNCPDRCIGIDFNGLLTSEEVGAFVASFPGLTLVEDEFSSFPFALVCVEPGQELAWMDTFEAQDIVKSTELNQIARTPEQCMPTPLPATPLPP